MSIAVASARQAEDASQLAHQASSAARRSMAVVVGSGVLGILLAVGVIAGTYLHRGAGIIMAATDAVGADLPPDSPPRPMDGQSPASPPQMPMTPPATVSRKRHRCLIASKGSNRHADTDRIGTTSGTQHHRPAGLSCSPSRLFGALAIQQPPVA